MKYVIQFTAGSFLSSIAIVAAASAGVDGAGLIIMAMVLGAVVTLAIGLLLS